MVSVLLVRKVLITHRLFLDFGCLLNSLCGVGVVQGSSQVGGVKGGGGKPKETDKHVRTNRKANINSQTSGVQ